MNNNAYNFDNKYDLINFIQNLLDGYCPFQLSQLDSDLVYDAIHYMKDNNIELTGNGIYYYAVEFGISNADKKIINWKNYINESELSDEQINLLNLFAKHIENEGGLVGCNIIECFANGSLDSSVYWTNFISEDSKNAIEILKEYTDIFSELADNISLDLDALDMNNTKNFDLEIANDY